MIYSRMAWKRTTRGRLNWQKISRKRKLRLKIRKWRLLRRLFPLIPESKEPRTRRTRVRDPDGRQWEKSSWFEYLVRDDNVMYHSRLNNPGSTEAIVFRKRFRVPWKFYNEFLLPWTIERFP